MASIDEALAVAREHHQAGRLEEAERIYRQILGAAPDHSAALALLGHLYRVQGRFPEAITCFQQAIERKPDDYQTLNGLGTAYAEQGNLDAAVGCFRQAILWKPDYADAHNNLGNALAGQGKLDDAVASYRQALAWRPDFPEACNGLGSALEGLGLRDEAAAWLGRALERRPDYVLAHSNLGIVLRGQGKLGDAIAHDRRALEIRPDFVAGHLELGSALREQGELDEAIACFQRAVALRPDYAAAHSGLLNTLHYRAGVTLRELSAAHAEFDRRHAAPLRGSWRPHDNQADPGRRLRLGFVSPDFGLHPVSLFLIRVLENLDRRECDVVCYADSNQSDPMTARIQAAATSWRNALAMTDDRLAQQIRADRIDILFDLAGHTPTNRLLVFARKPAPIQITWIGYEGTTGLSAMDYLLADRYVVPSESEAYYHERILRLPDAYLCFDPPEYAPAVGPLPALAGGPFTFASFNNPAKITPPIVACWARILERLPRARLILKYRGLDDAATAGRLRKRFADQGIAAGHVETVGLSPHAGALRLYHQVDLALDTFPFGGGATTCDALWMGVPVVTCPGETFASRHGLSYLSSVGLPEMIAHTLDEYVDLAVSLAGDLARLAAIRADLRGRMIGSPLCDGRRFARSLMGVLRQAWIAWVREQDSPLRLREKG